MSGFRNVFAPVMGAALAAGMGAALAAGIVSLSPTVSLARRLHAALWLRWLSTDTVMRYNISLNDGAGAEDHNEGPRLFFNAGQSDGEVYHNTFLFAALLTYLWVVSAWRQRRTPLSA